MTQTEWRWWPERSCAVRVLEDRDLWGSAVSEVFIPSAGTVERVAAERLAPLSSRPWVAHELAWRAAAGRAIQLLANGQHAGLRERLFEPLPHQLAVLDRALGSEPVRLALCDEVGMGKTPEALMVMTELKARHVGARPFRTLVVAPKGVQLQWVAEANEKFGEELVRVGPEGLPVDAGIDPWTAFDQVICSLDSVKPVRRRAGWSERRLAEHNERRFRAVIDAGWDLVVFDEAHRVAGASDDVARHRLARELAEITPHLLLLSGTPHSGKSDAFRRFLTLLDPAFASGRALNRDAVRELIVRNEKTTAIDVDGRPLFPPLTTSLEVVPYGDRRLERALYEAVTDYVRHGWDRAKRERRPAIGFLVLLMQRLVSSSTTAIRIALERRLSAVVEAGTQLRFFSERGESWAELSGEEQYAALENAQGEAWGNERAEVELLLDLARRTEAAGTDTKAVYLLDLLRGLQRDEGDPSAKLLVFTEFVATQDMLLGMLERAGVHAVALNGSMGIDERALAQEEFATAAQVLVSTDAGGEGINLQFAHLVVNYDLPWAPTAITQRLGRVHRVKQRFPVRAFNLVLENSVDRRVLEVLGEKLEQILAEVGIDKREEVLQSASLGIEELYAQAIAEPERLDEDATGFAARVRDDVLAGGEMRELLAAAVLEGSTPAPPEQLPDLLTRMADAYAALGHPRPPDPLTLLDALPGHAPTEPAACITGPVPGWWTLWEARAHDGPGGRDCLAVFQPDHGPMRPDIATQVWEGLVQGSEVRGSCALEHAVWVALSQTGLDYGFGTFDALARGRDTPTPWLALLLAVRVDP